MKAKQALVFIISFSAIILTLSAVSQTTEFTYVHPMAGSENLNPEQNIVLKHKQGIDPASVQKNSISINGSISGTIEFELMLAEDNKTILLTPVKSFTLGEMVSVSIPRGIKTVSVLEIKPVQFSFSILDFDRAAVYARLEELSVNEEIAVIPNNGIIRKDYIDDNNLPPYYPAPTVVSYGPPDDEYVFLSLFCRNSALPWESYITIIDSYGTPVFYEKAEVNRINFHVLPNGLLSYSLNYFVNNENEKYYIMDSSYAIVDSIKTGNGYNLDAHDMILMENGNYMVMSYDPQPVDMSQIVAGGDPEAIVTGLIIQEVSSDQSVIFQWRSWDHFEITDATYDINLTAANIDYVHGNALEIDYDGHLLLSSRNMDEITKININNGELIWRFGLNCENNMFNIQDDPIGFSHQHDIRLMSNGHYSIYDNGNNHSPQFTQALIYDIDEELLSASRIYNYQHSPQVYAGSMGSFRVQPNGEKIIGWGGYYPLMTTELAADNSVLREYFVPDWVLSYRSIKSSWETNMFETQEELSMGNFSGYAGWKENYLYIFNTSNEVIKITSTHNHLDEIEIDETNFPLSIFPNSYNKITVKFQAGSAGTYHDRLTLNYDNEGNTKRIARQLEIQAVQEEETPAVFFNPTHGTENVNPNLEIVISFSEPVRKTFGGEIQNGDIAALIDMKAINYKGEDVPFQGIINDEKTQITIIPEQTLNENKQYYLVLKHGLVSDYDNHVISLDEESYFKTGLLIGIEDIRDNEIQVYPNPFSNQITIKNQHLSNQNIRIYNGAGKLIHEEAILGETIQISTQSYPPGIYFIKVTNKGSQHSTVYKTIKH